MKKILSVILVMVIIMALGTPLAVSAAKDYVKYAQNLDKTTYTKDDLGATYTKDMTTFKVWSPTANLVKVKLYTTGSDSEKGAKIISETSMEYDKKTGVWSVKIKGNQINRYYTYLVYYDTKIIETVDIYAKAVGVNGNRGMIVDLDSTDPEGWDTDKRVLPDNPTEPIIWEVHIKDFSNSVSSGISEKNRGKYLAFTELNTRLNGIADNPETCVAYLKKLGITHVQINPFYDFASVDETGPKSRYNWGYDPKNYNVPEGSYSSNPYDGNVRITECKQMIQALHNAGIGVIMDVVYNHTYEDKNSWFNRIVPDYYYRINKDGTWSNGSGCGNDTASERKMFRKFMIDSVTYWAEEYHIDGFRFDLMGLHDVTTMNDIRASLDKLEDGEKIIMYGEAWILDTTADPKTTLATQANMSKLSERIAAFNDSIRDAIKGSVFDATDKGFIQGDGNRSQLQSGIAGQLNTELGGWASAESQTVTYAACHDNNTLYDKLVLSVLGEENNFYSRYNNLVDMNKLSAAIVLTSRGIPFIHAGEELCRSKEGDENSYKSPAAINEINWENINTFSDVYEYYRGLISIRKQINSIRSDDGAEWDVTFYENTAKSVVAYKMTPKGSPTPEVHVLLNKDTEKSVSAALEGVKADASYEIIANDKTAGLNSLGQAKGSDSVEILPSSAIILTSADFLSEISSDESKVIIEYRDESNNELITRQVFSGKTGDTRSINIPGYIALNYDFVGKADLDFEYADTIQTIFFKMRKYEGKISSVTFDFVDEETGDKIAPSVVATNREGEKYALDEIPSVKNYNLIIEDLPDGIAGKITDSEKTITLKYKKAVEAAADEEELGLANVFFFDENGTILDQVTLTGKHGEAFTYEFSQASADEIGLENNNEPISGSFSQTEQNFIQYCTLPEKEADASMIIWLVAGLAVAVVALGAGIGFSVLKKRAGRKNDLEIDED